MLNDVNNLDTEDIGLKQIMGDRFQDETAQPSTAEKASNKASDTPYAVKAEQKPVSGPKMGTCNTQWEPAKPAPNWMDNLKECVKSVAIFGGLNLLIFYWQQTGLMDASIAMPSMCVCAALAGFGVGKNFVKECRR